MIKARLPLIKNKILSEHYSKVLQDNLPKEDKK